MKKIIIFGLIFCALNAQNFESVYAQKKDEILREYEKLDLAKEEFEAYKASTLALLKQKDDFINQRAKDANETLAQVIAKEENIKKMLEEKEENIKKMLERNEELLNSINGASQNKVQEIYAKMKDGPAAAIISDLPRDEAAKILFYLQPKKVSAILAKTDPSVASELTQLLKDKNLFNDANSSK